jgi:hypothetical protein
MTLLTINRILLCVGFRHNSLRQQPGEQSLGCKRFTDRVIDNCVV